MDFLSDIQRECGFKNPPAFLRNLSGGDINQVCKIKADGRRYVVKMNNRSGYPKMLAKEFRALKFLSQNSPLKYPEVLTHFEAEDRQFLVMEFIEPGANSETAQELLGKGLAGQHRCSRNQFGWTEDNFIGSLLQPNSFTDSWSDFYAQNRILFQAKLAFDSNLLEQSDLAQTERLCSRFSELIPEEKPALLHGDLWSGNYLISADGIPTLYDPAIYFGHREIDLAMTRLFGGFGKTFYRSYTEEFSPESGWEERLPVFQLYPYLVHLNLFGRSYLSSIREIVNRF